MSATVRQLLNTLLDDATADNERTTAVHKIKKITGKDREQLVEQFTQPSFADPLSLEAQVTLEAKIQRLEFKNAQLRGALLDANIREITLKSYRKPVGMIIGQWSAYGIFYLITAAFAVYGSALIGFMWIVILTLIFAKMQMFENE